MSQMSADEAMVQTCNMGHGDMKICRCTWLHRPASRQRRRQTRARLLVTDLQHALPRSTDYHFAEADDSSRFI